MKLSLLLATVFLCMFTINCGRTGARVTPVEFSKACSPENENKYVQVSGFLEDKGNIRCADRNSIMDCNFLLIERPGSDKNMNAYIHEGSGANNVEKLPNHYRKEDVKFHDSNGKIVGLGEKLNITGKMGVSTDLKACFIDVTKIEGQ